MDKYIKEIKKIYDKSICSILDELDKYDIEDVNKIYILKEALGIDSNKAQSLFLSRNKGEITDKLLDDFLGD